MRTNISEVYLPSNSVGFWQNISRHATVTKIREPSW